MNLTKAFDVLNTGLNTCSLLFITFIKDIFSFLTTCDMCNYADDNTYMDTAEILPKFKNI